MAKLWLMPLLLLAFFWANNWPPQLLANVVKIAHLQPNNPAIQHEPQVLKMCSANLKERKILPDAIAFEVFTMESCNRFSGVEHAAHLHYMRNASVYFGPGCNNGQFYWITVISGDCRDAGHWTIGFTLEWFF